MASYSSRSLTLSILCGSLLFTGACADPSGTEAIPEDLSGSPGIAPDSEQPQACSGAPLVPQRLWRLSNAQYANAATDLLGSSDVPTVTGGGQSAFSFYSADTETVNDALAFSYASAAEAVANSVDVAALAGCLPDELEEACALRFVRSFAARAFRRPATEPEVADLLNVYRAGLPEGHEGGLRLVIEAALNAPSFVYRTEFGAAVAADRAQLTPHELASALSFLLLDSTPDAELLAAADSGALGLPGGIEQQFDRLLALPRVQQNITRVVVDWFGAPQVLSKSKTDPGFTEALKNDLITESRLFIHDNLWTSAAGLGGLITSNRTFLNSTLATFYGVAVPGATETTFAPFDYPPGEHAGLLTQASVMAMHADVEETSVVLRGKFMRNEVLCLSPLPPPPAIASDPSVVAALAAAQTERAKAEYRAQNPVCSACHGGLDPLGLTFERFDSEGRYREEHEGAPVDPSASFAPQNFPGTSALDGIVNGAADLAGRIAGEATTFTNCAVQKLTSYAAGRAIQRWGGEEAVCRLDAIAQSVPADQVTIPALLRSIALSSVFRTRYIVGGS